MSYVIINKIPIYLSVQRFKELENEVTKDKDPIWITSSTIQGHKESIEKSELIYEFLNQKFIEDSERFLKDWLQFDFEGEEASLNVWDLLYDHCVYYGNSFLQDHRDFQEKLSSDYEGESLIYPMGKNFTLNYRIKDTKRLWLFQRKISYRLIQIVITTNKVYHIVGTLSNFKIYTKSFNLTCNENIEIQ